MQEVVGRDAELESIAAWLDAPADAVLLIEGEAGIGKTTLVRTAVDLAERRDYLILRSTPAPTETRLSFSALRDLLDEAFAQIEDELPEPQKHALAVTLLQEDPHGDPPERGAISVALLSALRALGRRRPTLVAIDDVQWLDSASRGPLRYALRRLGDDSVRVLVARRSEEGRARDFDLVDGDRLRVIATTPLSVGALGRILHAQLDAAYARPTLRRIHEISGGNPFYALQLARSLGNTPVLGPAAQLPVPSSLHELVDERLLALPPRTLDALAAAAMLSRPTATQLATVLPGDTRDALAPAVEAQIVRDGDDVEFTHPLYAAAVYDLTPPKRRAELHGALAGVVDEREERARHLASATIDPDASVASAVDAGAEAAALRGATAVAAQLKEQAHRLTPGDRADERTQLALDAGWYWFVAGDGDRARLLLESGLSAASPGHNRASALIRLGRFESQAGDRRTAIDLFREALVEVGSNDPALEAEIHEALGWAIHLTRGDALVAQRHARNAIGLAETVGDDHVLASALVVLAQSTFFSGGGLAEATFERAYAVSARAPGRRVLARPHHHWGFLLLCSDRLDEARAVMLEMRELARVRGDETALPWILMRLAQLELYAGNWDDADSLVEDGLDVALHAHQRPIHADLLCTMALFAAHRGDAARARDLADDGMAAAVASGTGIGSPIAEWGLALLDLSLGDHEACASRLEPLLAASERAHVLDPGVNRYVPDLVEALIAAGRVEDAAATLGVLEERAERLSRPSVQASAGRCRGLLLAQQGNVDAALVTLEDAVARHEESPLPLELGRTLLALGEQQRRARRRRSARASLERALVVFEELGAELWAAKARSELGRIAGRAPSPDGLTPTETRVAELVAAGKSNKQVAAELVISIHTVEAALTSIYRKLEVHSRTEMAAKLVE